MYVVIQNDGRIIGQGPLKVYNMGGFWKVGGRHRGGSLVDYLYREKFNFTNLLKEIMDQILFGEYQVEGC